MTQAIQFLDAIGRSPALHGAPAAYNQAVDSLDAVPELRDALLRRDAAGLAGLLGARPRMVCAICTPDSDDVPLRSPDREDEGEGKEDPDREDRSPAGE
ncbi:hypothetical protein [Luteimonas terricola]|uniref:Uncharacterized protein n=1 Tax=Luteimonas terricola TaxID=645597 RepID=A0ABQ2EBB9_9GAMM|nr:hypothetical protein [Luteimonas terricola]GGK04189.1 hypothetical protein GCM10011394_11450 [Luteimonas terricola]